MATGIKKIFNIKQKYKSKDFNELLDMADDEDFNNRMDDATITKNKITLPEYEFFNYDDLDDYWNWKD